MHSTPFSTDKIGTQKNGSTHKKVGKCGWENDTCFPNTFARKTSEKIRPRGTFSGKAALIRRILGLYCIQGGWSTSRFYDALTTFAGFGCCLLCAACADRWITKKLSTRSTPWALLQLPHSGSVTLWMKSSGKLPLPMAVYPWINSGETVVRWGGI